MVFSASQPPSDPTPRSSGLTSSGTSSGWADMASSATRARPAATAWIWASETSAKPLSSAKAASQRSSMPKLAAAVRASRAIQPSGQSPWEETASRPWGAGRWAIRAARARGIIRAAEKAGPVRNFDPVTAIMAPRSR